MNQEFEKRIDTVIDKACIYKNEEMKNHTTFRVGGPADYYVTPRTREELAAVTGLCRELEVPFYVIGKGSNLLVGDKGYRGVMIQGVQELAGIRTEEEKITAQAGASLAQIASAALAEELSGLEFAAGIPGTVGGAVVMNAGAYGGEMKDVLESVTVLTQEGEILELPAEKLGLGYRTSIIPSKGYIVLEAVMRLKKGNAGEIREKMQELREQRVSKQPLEYPSAGSTFKRPEGHFAGKLIQDAGLKGFSVGGAQVSEKHSGFVINTGTATASDIKKLIEEVIRKVQEDFGVTLEPEVKQIGEF